MSSSRHRLVKAFLPLGTLALAACGALERDDRRSAPAAGGDADVELDVGADADSSARAALDARTLRYTISDLGQTGPGYCQAFGMNGAGAIVAVPAKKVAVSPADPSGVQGSAAGTPGSTAEGRQT